MKEVKVLATQALYRAWRPACFQDVAGQEAIVTTLRNQVASGRISHAYLFCGSRGTGKTTFAKILARAVNCETPRDGDLCGVCDTCRALAPDNNLDIVEIDAASNNGVDEIRDLRDKIKYPPQHGRYRVYIIDEVHMLSTGAFNALLKTLEEPPSHAIFILATTEPQKLPATVLSRCQRYDFRRFPVQTIIDRMKVVVEGEKSDVRPDALSLIARAAEGGMRDALSLLDMCLSYGGGSVDAALVREVLGAADRGFLFEFTGYLLRGDAASVLRAIDALMRSGREPQVFARDVTHHLRALMLAQTCGDSLADLLEITGEDARQYQRQAGDISRERLLLLLDLFISTETDMKWASQPRIALEVNAARACLPDDALRLDTLLARVELLEKKLASGIMAAPPAKQAQSGNDPQALPTAPQGKLKAAAPSANAPAAFPAPATPPEADAATGPQIWDRAIKLLRKEPSIYSQMMQGRFTGITGDTATMVFQKGGEIFLNTLRQPARLSRIEALLSEAAGKPMRLQLDMEASPAAPVAAKNTIQRVFDAFGRENVQVVDET